MTIKRIQPSPTFLSELSVGPPRFTQLAFCHVRFGLDEEVLVNLNVNSNQSLVYVREKSVGQTQKSVDLYLKHPVCVVNAIVYLGC